MEAEGGWVGGVNFVTRQPSFWEAKSWSRDLISRVVRLFVYKCWKCVSFFLSLHNMTGLHAPQNVKVYSTCSTCLRATWDPVIVPIHENPLTGYRLVCRQEVSEKTITKFVGPTESSANLKSLQKFSSYTITVSSMAKSELGDPSEPVTVTTLEDGKAVI